MFLIDVIYLLFLVVILLTHSLTLVVVKFHILTIIIIQIKCLKFLWWYFEFIFLHWLYHDTLKFSVNYDCIMIQWVSISEMKEAWNGSFLLHLPCLYDFGYVHWMYHDTFKLWINIECIMIQSRVKPEILSSNCVLIRKPPHVHMQKLNINLTICLDW